MPCLLRNFIDGAFVQWCYSTRTEVRLEPVRSDESGKGALSTEYQSSGNGTNGQDSKSLSFAANRGVRDIEISFRVAVALSGSIRLISLI